MISCGNDLQTTNEPFSVVFQNREVSDVGGLSAAEACSRLLTGEMGWRSSRNVVPHFHQAPFLNAEMLYSV